MEKYKIVVGTTDSKNKAQQQYNLITGSNVMNLGIKIYKMDNGELYSVEAGPYSKRKQILQDLDKIKNLGITHAFITDDL